MRRWQAMGLMSMAACSYAVVTPLVKLASNSHIPVALLTVFQFPAAFLFFTSMSVGTRQTSQPKFTSRDWLLMMLIGVAVAATGLTYYQSLKHLPASLAIVFLFQFSWMLPVIGWIASRKAPTRTQWLAIAAIGVGTVVAARAQSLTALSLTGLTLGLGAGLAYALTLFWQGRFANDSRPWLRSLVSTIVAGVVVTLVYRPWHLAGHAVWPALAVGSLAGMVGQALPMVLTYMSARTLGPALTAILASLELPVAVMLSHVWLNEAVAPWQWIGVTLMLAAIAAGAMSNRTRSRTG